MLEKLKSICDKYEELCAKSEQPDFYADPKKAADRKSTRLNSSHLA